MKKSLLIFTGLAILFIGCATRQAEISYYDQIDKAAESSLPVEMAITTVGADNKDVVIKRPFIGSVIKKGFLITAAHCVEYGDPVEPVKGVIFKPAPAKKIEFSLKKEVIKLVYSDPKTDIAVFQVPERYNPLAVGDSNKLRLGEKVIVVAFPDAKGIMIKEGIVARTIDTGQWREDKDKMRDCFSIYCSVVPGDSGSAVLVQQNDELKIVGIAVAQVMQDNVGFVLKINTAMEAIGAFIQ